MLEGIKVLKHSSIKFEKENKVIYFDPYKIDEESHDADIIFCTHFLLEIYQDVLKNYYFFL